MAVAAVTVIVVAARSPYVDALWRAQLGHVAGVTVHARQ